MKKIRMTYAEMKARFREHESLPYQGRTPQHLVGYIVFTEGSFDKEYSKESRTYEVSSNNKAFIPGMGGYSIYGSAIDGSDYGVRLEQYMAEERGDAGNWIVDHCYMMEAENEEGN